MLLAILLGYMWKQGFLWLTPLCWQMVQGDNNSDAIYRMGAQCNASAAAAAAAALTGSVFIPNKNERVILPNQTSGRLTPMSKVESAKATDLPRCPDSTAPAQRRKVSDAVPVQDRRGVESSECLLSTQVPYSDEYSTSSVSLSTDTASSPNCGAVTGSSRLGSLSSEVNSFRVPAPEVCCRSAASSGTSSMLTSPCRNPDNLQSILPSSMTSSQKPRLFSSDHHQQQQQQQHRCDEWSWAMLADQLSKVQPTTCATSMRQNNCDGNHYMQWTCDPTLTWQNLCELPGAPNQDYVETNHANTEQLPSSKWIPLDDAAGANYESMGANQWPRNNHLRTGMEEVSASSSARNWNVNPKFEGYSAPSGPAFVPGQHDFYALENIYGSMVQYSFDDGTLFPHLPEDPIPSPFGSYYWSSELTQCQRWWDFE